MTHKKKKDLVGPVFTKCKLALLVIKAIQEENEHVSILDKEAYIRVLAPVKCCVSRQTIEKYTNQPFVMPNDLEAIMPAFKGILEMTDHSATWSS